MAKIFSVGGERVLPLSDGWELSQGSAEGPWLPARVPGTVAQALRDAGRYSLDQATPLHGTEFWFRTRFDFTGPFTLRLGGLATIAEVFLNGEKVLSSDNMFLGHALEAKGVGSNELKLRFLPLTAALAAKKGRAKWRPRMIEPTTLRAVRTTLLGNLPGWCPPVHAVGPWRPVERVEPGPLRVLSADVRSNLEDRDGVVALELKVAGEKEGAAGRSSRAESPRSSRAESRDAVVTVGQASGTLRWIDATTLRGDVRVNGAEPWWPHTHGNPALYPLRARIGEVDVDLGRIGFRSLEVDDTPDGRGFALRLNGQRIFCRGACWSTADIIGLPGTRDAYRPWLERMRDAGLNMVRVGGTMAYESDDFFALCDELGLMVWQDFMFANFDYPVADAAFAASVTEEARQLLDRTQTSPSLVVLCGGSEVQQQASMFGLPKASWTSPLFEELLPGQVLKVRPDVAYVPNSPSGGELPFSADTQVTHYYGVGAYLRPLEDARRAEVKFASECLAFANVPEQATVAKVLAAGEAPGHHPKWKARVPRDVGASWDFEDVREHYLRALYGVVPQMLRYENPDRYLRMSRAVTGEVIEETFAEWRRARSGCGGGLVWLYQDLWPGAGWGVVDSLGAPKAAWHALRRACRPIQVTLSDEGVNGLAVHVHNETGMPWKGKLAVQCLREGAVPVVQAERELLVPARGSLELPVAALFDAFFDTTYAYRFGPPAHDVTVASLHTASGARVADAFHFPLGRGADRVELGLTAQAEETGDGWHVRLQTKRLAQSVHFDDEHFRADEEWFHLVPNVERRVRLIPRAAAGPLPDGEVHALNGTGVARFKGQQ
jgi:beta-mannosidase